jgi:hypothetical protein
VVLGQELTVITLRFQITTVRPDNSLRLDSSQNKSWAERTVRRPNEMSYMRCFLKTSSVPTSNLPSTLAKPLYAQLLTGFAALSGRFCTREFVTRNEAQTYARSHSDTAPPERSGNLRSLGYRVEQAQFSIHRRSGVKDFRPCGVANRL